MNQFHKSGHSSFHTWVSTCYLYAQSMTGTGVHHHRFKCERLLLFMTPPCPHVVKVPFIVKLVIPLDLLYFLSKRRSSPKLPQHEYMAVSGVFLIISTRHWTESPFTTWRKSTCEVDTQQLAPSVFWHLLTSNIIWMLERPPAALLSELTLKLKVSTSIYRQHFSAHMRSSLLPSCHLNISCWVEAATLSLEPLGLQSFLGFKPTSFISTECL